KTPELKAGTFHSPAYRHCVFEYLSEMKKFRIRPNGRSVGTFPTRSEIKKCNKMFPMKILTAKDHLSDL
ncbi:hypothetical protein, partial [Enterobacter ludwigii]|uniref:hypothetical protein n=1 Tax=Enterobacter ludwigii TaxID=299767 RepID=UPI0019D1C20E